MPLKARPYRNNKTNTSSASQHTFFPSHSIPIVFLKSFPPALNDPGCSGLNHLVSESQESEAVCCWNHKIGFCCTASVGGGRDLSKTQTISSQQTPRRKVPIHFLLYFITPSPKNAKVHGDSRTVFMGLNSLPFEIEGQGCGAVNANSPIFGPLPRIFLYKFPGSDPASDSSWFNGQPWSYGVEGRYWLCWWEGGGLLGLSIAENGINPYSSRFKGGFPGCSGVCSCGSF